MKLLLTLAITAALLTLQSCVGLSGSYTGPDGRTYTANADGSVTISPSPTFAPRASVPVVAEK